MGSDENGKRYQLLINRPAQLMIWLTDFILTIQSFFFSTLSPSDYNYGATLIPAGMCVYIFPLNLQFGEASGDAPVKCFYSYTCRS
jgi:hypothetical protein